MARNKTTIHKDSLSKIAEKYGEDILNDKELLEQRCNDLIKDGIKFSAIGKEAKLLLELLLLNAEKLGRTEQVQKNLSVFLKEQNLGIFDTPSDDNE